MATIPDRGTVKEWAQTAAFGLAALIGLSILVVTLHPKKSHGDVPLPATAVGGVSLAPVLVLASFAKNTLGIPVQKITAPIEPETVDAHGYLGIPSNIQHVGYYTGAAPLDGQGGGLVVAGHVDWVGQGVGALGRIGTLHTGDVVITRGTSKPQAWRVTRVTSYLKAEGLPAAMFDGKGKRELSLVTCGGTLNTRTGSYLSNIVVTATPVPTVVG